MLTYYSVARLSEYHTEPTVFTVRPVRPMRTFTTKPRLFLLCWHRRDVDLSNAEDDMKPPRSSPAFAVATDRRNRMGSVIQALELRIALTITLNVDLLNWNCHTAVILSRGTFTRSIYAFLGRPERYCSRWSCVLIRYEISEIFATWSKVSRILSCMTIGLYCTD